VNVSSRPLKITTLNEKEIFTVLQCYSLQINALTEIIANKKLLQRENNTKMPNSGITAI